MGQDDVFTCDQTFSNKPDSATCWGADHGPGGGFGGGYDCNETSRTCVPVPPFVAPTYTSLSECINGCRPDATAPPYWRCNSTSAQCEQASDAGTTLDRCTAQCQEHKLCVGGVCQSQGVDCAGNWAKLPSALGGRLQRRLGPGRRRPLRLVPA